MPSGGYRQPSKPAAVSGPGALSQRTDKGQPIRDISGGDYGDASEFRSLQQSAPVAQAAPMGGGGGAPAPAGPSMVGMGAPTQEPGTPITAGADAGAGPGMAALGLPGNDPTAMAKADAQKLAKYLPAMISAAQSENATPSFRRYVRFLIANS